MKLDTIFSALTECVYIVGPDEAIMEQAIREHAEKDPKKKCIVNSWSAGTGLDNTNEKVSPVEIIRYIQTELQNTTFANDKTRNLFILKDFHVFLKDPIMVRKLKDIIMDRKNFRGLVIIILSPVKRIPIELSRLVTVFDFGLPSDEKMKEIVAREVNQIIGRLEKKDKGVKYKDSIKEINRIGKEHIIEAITHLSKGMTSNEINNALRNSLLENPGEFYRNDLLLDYKLNCLRKVDTIKYVIPDVDINDVGGLHLLKEWLDKRKNSLSNEAKEFGIKSPKGVLMIGVPGNGKTLISKAIANDWELPMIQLEIGSIMSGVVGSSEANMRQAIEVIEAMAPCVLFIDEIEKNLSGTKSSNQSDSGTLARVYGQFITWLNDKDKDIFVVATANDISQLPPELSRRGRFDEMFYISLPNAEERAEILAIHLAKVGRDPGKFNVEAIAKDLTQFSGADIEEIVTTALINAFSNGGKDISDMDIINASKELTPIGITMQDKIAEILEWCEDHRVRNASLSEDESKTSGMRIINKKD